MGGGFLRIMYPAPEVCLDLKTWQEFYGFDRFGEYAWFSFEPDFTGGTVRIRPRPDEPVNAPGPARKIQLLRDPNAVKMVCTPEYVNCDITGAARERASFPGPFSSWDEMSI